MFRKIALIALAGFMAFLPVRDATAISPAEPWREPVGFIAMSAYVSAPRAFLDFCDRYPEDCTPPQGGVVSHIDLTDERKAQLDYVNGLVNDSLFFNSDVSNNDTWDYPQDGIGDCEDFVIEKRRRLMDMGWPEDALLITLVRLRTPDFAGRTGHAVLTVRTAQGDYVLDNTVSRAIPWTTAERLFEFVMIQTQTNPRLWALVDSPSSVH